MASTAIKDTDFNLRINKEKKDDLEDLYANRGTNLSETEEAIQEARDIMSGKVEAKSYNSVRKLFEEIDEG